MLTHDVVAQGDGGVSRGGGWRVTSSDREELAMKGFYQSQTRSQGEGKVSKHEGMYTIDYDGVRLANPVSC